MAEKYLIYFQPGQIIFHITRGFDLDPTPLIRWASNVAEKRGITITPSQEVYRFDTRPRRGSDSQKSSVQTGQVYVPSRAMELRRTWPDFRRLSRATPRATTPPPFSLVAATVTNPNWPPFKAYKPFEDQEAQAAQQQAFMEQLDLIKLLDDERDNAPPEFKVEDVSPNWLFSNTPSGSGTTGGPGGPPSPAEPANAGKYRFVPNSVYFPSALPSIKPEDQERAVVVILDTSYSVQELEDFRVKWPTHDLIQNLLGPSGSLRGANGQLNVTLDPLVANLVPDLTIDGHDYEMNDHSLFIAGIIDTIAPNSELHLYQVLNRYGVGDVLSLVRTLTRVIGTFGDRLDKVVVNASLSVVKPMEENPCYKDDGLALKILGYKPKPEWFWDLLHWLCRLLQVFFPSLRCRWSWFDRQAMLLEWVSDLLYVLGPSMVAAAGNNAANGHRPPASYPAAYDSVLGVGAWSRGTVGNTNAIVPASYSNLSDTPTTQGVIATGGEVGKKGLLGIYMGKIPDGTPNGTSSSIGMANWSGTSFATPIVSGLVAAWVNSGQVASTRDAINTIVNLAKKEAGTSAGESPIPVEQEK